MNMQLTIFDVPTMFKFILFTISAEIMDEYNIGLESP